MWSAIASSSEGMAVFASLLGYAESYYIAPFMLCATTALTCFCVARAVRRWKGILAWQRVYAVVTSGASSALLVAFIYGIAQDPMFSPRYLRGVWTIATLGGNISIDEHRTCDVWVDLSGTKATDEDLARLHGIVKLRSLSLQSTRVTDAGLTHLRGLASLERLNLFDTAITDSGLANLKDLPQLRWLNLAHTQVTDAGIELLKGLPKLESLDLSFCNVTDAGLEHLRALPNLTCLVLASTKVTDAGLAHLGGLTQLHWLDVGYTEVTEEGVKTLQDALPNCEIVHSVIFRQ